MAKNITIPYGYTPRPYQEDVLAALDNGIRNVCWVVHRRGGKDTTMWNYMIKRAYMEPGTYYYFLPSFAQAKRVLWDGMTNDGKRMLDYIPKQIINGNPNNTEMKVWINGAAGGQSLIQLIGADSYDAIMGTNPRGVVFSEWSLMDPMAYEFIKPILAANGGWAAFIYTPRGRNHGWDLAEIARRNPDEWFFQVLTVKETGVLTEAQIDSERRKGMQEDLISQEFYCDFNRGQEGSYYGAQIDGLRKRGQICRVAYDPSVPVRTYWDLGIGDSTAIWWAQFVGKEVHLINYYENSGEGLAHYGRILDEYRRDSGCVYDLHMAPHDIQARELTTGMSRLETAKRMGLNFRVAPKLRLESGIEAVRIILGRCWFDEKACEIGIKCLENYRKTYNEKFRVYSDTPFHDYTSHGCLDGDALISTPLGLKKIRDVKIGDHVLTPFGQRVVLWAGETKETNELMEITTSRGNRLLCTREHKVFAGLKGFTRCDALSYHDTLSSVGGRVKWMIRKKFYGMGSHIGFKETFGYPMMRQGRCSMGTYTAGMDFTTGGAALRESTPIVQFIGLCGHFIMGTYQRITTSITRIVTQKTTTSATSEFCINQSIADITASTTLRKRIDHAWFVSAISRFMSTLRPERVVKIAPVRLPTTRCVYDLTVEGDGCYYANGILVSNSDSFRVLATTESSFRQDRGVDDTDYENMRHVWGWKV